MSVTTRTTAPVTVSLKARPIPVVGAIAAVVGAVVLYGYGTLAIAAFGKLRAGDPGASHADPVVASSFSMGVVFCTVLGTVIATVIARRAADPAKTFTKTALVLTAVSLVPAAFATHTHLHDKLILAVGHLIAAAVVIPILSRRLAQR